MKFLITGGTGFVGSWIARRLVGDGQDAIVYDLFLNCDAIGDIADKVTLIRGDILDENTLVSIIKKNDVEYILHLAALLPVESQKNPSKAIRVNCEGTNNVFNVARITDVRRIVWASSVSVYGPPEYYAKQPVDEDAPLRPTTIYGACKAFNEFMAQWYHTTYSLDIIGLRPSMIYGVGRNPSMSGAIGDLFREVITGKPFKLPKPWYGSASVDWIYVEDIARAFILACRTKKPKHIVFNACSGQLYTTNEMVSYVKKLIPEAIIEVEQKPSWFRPAPLYDNTRIREELGFKPSYTLEEGIRETINRIRKQVGIAPI